MHAQVSTESIREAINKVTSVVDRKNTRPILAYTLVEAANGELSFSATDLEVSAKVKIEAITEVPGSFCVNAKNFSDILRELPNSSLELKIDDNESRFEYRHPLILDDWSLISHSRYLVFKIDFCSKSY